MLVIDILDDAALLQVGEAEPPRQGAILSPEPLLIHQQSKTFFEAALAGIGGLQLSVKGVSHAMQFHIVEFFNRLLIQHVGSFLQDLATAPAWWADRSNAGRASSHVEDRVDPSRHRARVGGRASASEWTSGFDTSRF